MAMCYRLMQSGKFAIQIPNARTKNPFECALYNYQDCLSKMTTWSLALKEPNVFQVQTC